MRGLAKRIWRVILPESHEIRWRRLELMIWAFVLSLAYYPGPFGFLAWFALVRPIIILSRLSGRAAFNAAYFFGFFYNLFTIYWVALVTPPGMITAVLIVAFYYAFVLYGFVKVVQYRAWVGFALLPFLWVGIEYFRTLSEFAFPWSGIGYTQGYYLYVLQIVSVISVHGLALLIVGVNVLLAQIFRKEVAIEKKVASFFLSLGTVVVLIGYGWVVMPAYPEPGSFPVTLLQGSVPLEIKWADEKQALSYQRYDSLAQSVEEETNLFIWPETSAPCYMTHDFNCRREVGEIARRSGRPHLVGSLAATEIEGRTKTYNSSFQFNSLGQIIRRYDKVKLVPFSEHVPYQDHLPFLQKEFLQQYLTFLDRGVQWWSDFYPGDSMKLFHVSDVDYGLLICFEATFPEYVRAMIRDGAQFMVGITNDTWFGRSVGVHMHSRIFITRMVETRCWGARAANTGLTYIVDGYGRIREALELYEVAVLTGEVQLLDEYTIFVRYGDVAGRFSFLITIGVLGILVGVWTGSKFKRSH